MNRIAAYTHVREILRRTVDRSAWHTRSAETLDPGVEYLKRLLDLAAAGQPIPESVLTDDTTDTSSDTYTDGEDETETEAEAEAAEAEDERE